MFRGFEINRIQRSIHSPKKTKRLSVRVSEEDDRAIRRWARHLDVPISVIISGILHGSIKITHWLQDGQLMRRMYVTMKRPRLNETYTFIDKEAASH